MQQKPGLLRIGTSNVVLPTAKASIPGAFKLSSRLHYYATLFNSLEINSTFYKIPQPSTFEKWSFDVPEQFQFTLKLWKEITHKKDLNFINNDVIQFVNAANYMGSKKGCLLLQFPGKITFEYFNNVDKILSLLTSEISNGWKIAVEFRNPTWYCGETFELMDQYKASVVLHDMPKAKNMQINKKATFIYLRFHGPSGDYRGSYSGAFLNEKAGLIRSWLKTGKDVYVYFNNTMGNAFENAQTLRELSF